MICFVDTSAFLACLVADDANHLEARAAFAELVEAQTPLATTNLGAGGDDGTLAAPGGNRRGADFP